MTAMTRQRRLPPVDSHARRKSKQDWNASHYAQVKVSVDPVIAAGFRTACAASGISMAKALSDFMLAFSDSPMPEAVSPSQNDPLPLSSRKLRRSAVERIVHDLLLVKSAEESYRDNIPQNLQASQRFDDADHAASCLDDAIDSLLDAFG